MASLTYASGRGTVQFTDADGSRRTVRLGKTNKRDAEAAAVFVSKLAEAKAVGAAPDRAASLWAAGLGDTLHARLARVGLIEPRASATLKAFGDGYIKSRGDWSQAMRLQFAMAVRNAVDAFGANAKLASITAADADRLRATLAETKKPATVRKRMRYLKGLFKQAIRARVLTENPFADQRTSNVTDPERLVYVPAETVSRVVDELTGEVRLALLLARFAGLRTPSEPDALKLADLNFDKLTMRVKASKTGRSRTIPIDPRVLPDLLKAHADAPDGAVYVFQHRRKLPVLRRAVERAATRAGVTLWEKPFQNCRSSYATDLVRVAPANVATAILGHTRAVAAEHYWSVGDADYSALQKALQNALHQAATSERKREPRPSETRKNQRENAQPSASDSASSISWMGQTGIEPALEGF